jgi:hypothetical protein
MLGMMDGVAKRPSEGLGGDDKSMRTFDIYRYFELI